MAKFTGKHLCQSLLLNKVAVLRPASLSKKRLWHRCFPVNFAIFLGKRSLQDTSERQRLKRVIRNDQKVTNQYTAERENNI